MPFQNFLVGAVALAGLAAAQAPVDQLEGFGAGTTGGGDGEGTTVSSCDDLVAAAEAGGVVKVDGMLDGCEVEPASDTSIIGVGSSSGLSGSSVSIKEVTNVIIRNLHFDVPPSGEDAVSIQQSSQIWIDHCELNGVGLTGDKDDYDGLLDITHAGDLITVSWNKFHDHWKASLVGHSDSNADEDTGALRVTYHHNSWDNINSRAPSLRFGTGHIYSSCYRNLPDSGINSRMGAQVLVEESYFEDVPLAIATALYSDEPGFATDLNNVFAGSSATEITQEASWTPDYEYTTDPADSVCGIIDASAGVGIVG